MKKYWTNIEKILKNIEQLLTNYWGIIDKILKWFWKNEQSLKIIEKLLTTSWKIIENILTKMIEQYKQKILKKYLKLKNIEKYSEIIEKLWNIIETNNKQ